VCCTIMIMISGISWAVCLGQVCGIVTSLNQDEQAFRSTMDTLNLMMRDRAISKDMQRQLRSFFLSNKVAQRRARHQHIVNAMSPGLQGLVALELNRTWIENVSFLRKILAAARSDSELELKVTPFVVEVSQKMTLRVHAQSEVFGHAQTLYILNVGLVSRNLKLHRCGSVWGSDFVLSDKRQLEPFESLALTYIEITILGRSDFLTLVEKYRETCPDLAKQVRRFCCWMSLQRAILHEAFLRRKAIAVQQSGKKAPTLALSRTSSSLFRSVGVEAEALRVRSPKGGKKHDSPTFGLSLVAGARGKKHDSPTFGLSPVAGARGACFGRTCTPEAGRPAPVADAPGGAALVGSAGGVGAGEPGGVPPDHAAPDRLRVTGVPVQLTI